MRIATWNCRMGLTRKQSALDRLAADILVVPEASAAYVPGGDARSVFKGAYPSKGLAVIAQSPLTLTVSPFDPGLPWLLPVDVHRGRELVVTCLALWTLKGPRDRRPSYVRQAQEAVAAWEASCQRFGREPWASLVLAGDFNASPQTGRGHLDTIESLHSRGLSSAYHRAKGVSHGDESQRTLRWVGAGGTARTYHCDYIWLSHDLAARLTDAQVGEMDEWVNSGLSDHAPVWADCS